tara:strand:+ start:6855 stop:7040 length:186 start_codon:yes stop_codon:yes gene_type:complete
MDNLKLIALIIGIFLLAFATSLLLELDLFLNPVRYILVILLILLELYFGYIVYNYINSGDS